VEMFVFFRGDIPCDRNIVQEGANNKRKPKTSLEKNGGTCLTKLVFESDSVPRQSRSKREARSKRVFRGGTPGNIQGTSGLLGRGVSGIRGTEGVNIS